TSLHFYHSKVKLNLQIIIFFALMIGSYCMAYIGVVERSFIITPIFLFFAIFISFFWCAAILKVLRRQPYVMLTNIYISINPKTKSEVTIYFDNIESIQVSETNLQKIIEIVIYVESAFFDQLSTHYKIRLGPHAWFGFKTFMILYKVIRRRE